MLRISKLTDYGVVLATRMAGSGLDRRHHARDLALSTGLSEPTVSKVLKRLAQHGVLESQRGARGGYRLAAAPEAISVAEVITALEGPIAVTECASEELAGECELEDRCEVRAPWQKISAAVSRALAEISLADMAQPSPPFLIQLGVSKALANGRQEWIRRSEVTPDPTVRTRVAKQTGPDEREPEASVQQSTREKPSTAPAQEIP